MMRPGERYGRIKGVFLLASAFAVIPMIATGATGLQVDVTPSARIEEGWVSNASDTSTGEDSSLTTRVTPGLALTFTALDGAAIQLSGNYEKNWYHDAEAKDAEKGTWNFRIASIGKLKEEWRLTPTFIIVPSLSYINTTNSVRRTQLVPSGDQEVPPVTVTNYGNTKTETIGGGIRFNYLMTRTVTLGVDGNYSRVRFDTPVDNAAQTGLTDSSSVGAGVSAGYQFSPRTTLGVKFSGSRSTHEDNPDTDSLSGQLTLAYLFTPTVKFDGSLGVQHIKRNAGPASPEESASSPSGRVNLSYIQETFTVTLFGSGVYSTVSGFGEATRQYTAGIRFTDQFARDWNLNLAGTYQISESAFETDAVDIRSINGSAGVQYRPWRWVTLDLTGHLNRQTSSGQFGEDLDSYSAHLGFTASKPYNLYR